MSGLGQIPSLPPSTDYDSASSGQKRRRDGSPTQSTSFLQSTRNLVSQRLNVPRCWNCEAPYTEFCHVVAKADPAYSAMMKKGMMTFGALGDFRNAIVLCGGCHNHFDRTSSTGWVFLPTDLDWFIEWEERDFANRKQVFEETGRTIQRTYPNEMDYEHRMRAAGLLFDPDDGMCRGGFYHSYILENMFAPRLMAALKEDGMTVPGVLPGGPKRWHGAPMAAINRGFVAIGTSEVKLPDKEWDSLHKLQRLYRRELPERTVSEAEPSGTRGLSERIFDQQQGATTVTGQQRDPSRAAEQTASGNQLQSRGPLDALLSDNRTDSAIDVRTRRYRKRRKVELGVDEQSWCFGPQTSSNDKAMMYYPVPLSD
ncbi:hypothetical protein H2198_005727 [Neophaeococcomyces mojaviensis]|uniref:Uncharacterized protein n=1 Tax=Neophaeococcomyces mojaviensis TaxID=3383035 RepID=A0ACC3A4W4_9EURO|nr:hypothetical protein H2198_005727 [Knufia sp. JES_112]